MRIEQEFLRIYNEAEDVSITFLTHDRHKKKRKKKHLDEKEASYMCNTDDDVNLERQ